MYRPELLLDCGHSVINGQFPYRGFEESHTMIGNKGQTPKRLWFDRNDSYGIKLTELTLYLPDLQVAEAKATEWRENKELFCRPTPRMLPAHNTDKTGLYGPIWTFNPPLEYNVSSGLELDTSAVLTWIPERSQLGRNDYSVEGPLSAKVKPKYIPATKYTNMDKLERKITDLTKYPPGYRFLSRANKQMKEEYSHVSPGKNIVPSFSIPAARDLQTSEDDLQMYNEARQLVILDSSINKNNNHSAAVHCTHRLDDASPDHHIKRDAGENPDYLSYNEGIYCDMLMKTMFPLCNEINKELYFDTDVNMLRRFGSTPNPTWVEHDHITVEGSEDHKKMSRQIRAVEAAAKVASDNEIAQVKGIPITYRLGQPKPLWSRPYHPNRIVHME